MTAPRLKTLHFLLVFVDGEGFQVGAVVLPALRVEDARTLAPEYSPPEAATCWVYEIAPLGVPSELPLALPNPVSPQPPSPSEAVGNNAI